VKPLISTTQLRRYGVNVRFGSKADIGGRLGNVRFTPKSGHRNSRAECPLCAKSRHYALQQNALIKSDMYSICWVNKKDDMLHGTGTKFDVVDTAQVCDRLRSFRIKRGR
jgi:hypothetical protein